MNLYFTSVARISKKRKKEKKTATLQVCKIIVKKLRIDHSDNFVRVLTLNSENVTAVKATNSKDHEQFQFYCYFHTANRDFHDHPKFPRSGALCRTLNLSNRSPRFFISDVPIRERPI